MRKEGRGERKFVQKNIQSEERVTLSQPNSSDGGRRGSWNRGGLTRSHATQQDTPGICMKRQAVSGNHRYGYSAEDGRNCTDVVTVWPGKYAKNGGE